MADLRTRIEAAVWPTFRPGPDCEQHPDEAALVERVMAVVNETLHRVEHENNGKCRWCYQLVNTAWAKALGKETRPHRMTCRFYVGPVEHRRIRASESWMGFATWIECACGTSWNQKERDDCPNSAEAWRGPQPAEEAAL